MEDRQSLSVASIVKIECGNNDEIYSSGVGFFVSPCHIFTATHVLVDKYGNLFDEITVYSVDENNKFINKLSVEVLKVIPEANGDIALLCINQISNFQIRSLNLIVSKLSESNECNVYGFPAYNKINGLLAKAKIGQNITSDTDIKQIIIEDCDAIASGFSGSPIYDPKLQGVIGILTNIANPKLISTSKPIGFAATSEQIAKLFSQFFVDSLSIKDRLESIRNSLSVGEKIKGKIIDIVEFGAFIDYKDIHGLIHKTRAGYNKISQMQVGDEIEVIVYNKRYSDSYDRTLIEFAPVYSKEEQSNLKSFVRIAQTLINENLRTKSEILDLSKIGIDTIPENIAFCTHIKTLNLSNNRLDYLPVEMIQLCNLVTLDLSNNQFSRIPSILLEIQTLSSLDISSNRITKVDSFLFRINNLSKLKIHNNPIIDNQKILLSDNFEIIKEYHLKNLANITNEIPIDNFYIGQEIEASIKVIYPWGIFLTISTEKGFKEGVLHKKNIDKDIFKIIKKTKPIGEFFCLKINMISTKAKIIFETLQPKFNQKVIEIDNLQNDIDSAA